MWARNLYEGIKDRNNGIGILDLVCTPMCVIAMVPEVMILRDRLRRTIDPTLGDPPLIPRRDDIQ
jgi:hypothetical protein